jgi:hypothetical protein
MDGLMHLMHETKPIRATLETADGGVITGMVYAAKVNVRQDIHDIMAFGDVYPRQALGFMSWDIELKGTGPIEMSALRVAEDVRKKVSAIEWKCDYCGAIHPRREVKCCGCGASRSFVYG